MRTFKHNLAIQCQVTNTIVDIACNIVSPRQGSQCQFQRFDTCFMGILLLVIILVVIYISQVFTHPIPVQQPNRQWGPRLHDPGQDKGLWTIISSQFGLPLIDAASCWTSLAHLQVYFLYRPPGSNDPGVWTGLGYLHWKCLCGDVIWHRRCSHGDVFYPFT